MELLTTENYRKGFLVDDEWMAGVTEDPENKQSFVAFILSHATGQYVGYHPFPTLETAIQAVNQIPRKWAFEKIGGCGGGNCGKEGGCAAGKCGVGGGCKDGSCPA